MTEFAYSHRSDGDYQGSFSTATEAAAAGAIALDDFLQDADERVYFVAEFEPKTLGYFAPDPYQLVGDLTERIVEAAGDTGDETVSWLEENVGSTTSGSSILTAADLSTNFKGVLDWFAQKHSIPAVRILVGRGAYAVNLLANQEWAWADGADNG